MVFLGNFGDVIVRLKSVMLLYKILVYFNFIECIDYFEMRNGYVVIFEWFIGECLYLYWLFVGEVKYSYLELFFYKFK